MKTYEELGNHTKIGAITASEAKTYGEIKGPNIFVLYKKYIDGEIIRIGYILLQTVIFEREMGALEFQDMRDILTLAETLKPTEAIPYWKRNMAKITQSNSF